MRHAYEFTAAMYSALNATNEFEVTTSDSAPETLKAVLKTIAGK